LQYASEEYVRVLEKHRIIPSMSRPANPYDNASCESFIKTLPQNTVLRRFVHHVYITSHGESRSE
jgi:transposase InsO family protein